MSKVTFRIKIDGFWSEAMEAEELRKYSFDECIMVETMTRAEYDRRYTHISTALDDAITEELANGTKSIMREG